MNTIREIQRINEEELSRGIAGTSASWHDKYSGSAWVYAGNLDHDLSEGDVLCVLSQFGELEDIHLARDDDTGKSRGFAFCKYEDARSCVLAVDNLTGAQLCGRSLRVDHVENYRLPKNLAEKEEEDGEETNLDPGHAYQGQELGSKYTISRGQDLFAPPEPEETTKKPQQQQKQQKAVDNDGDSISSSNGSISSSSSDGGGGGRRSRDKKRKQKKEKKKRRRERERRRDERGEKRRSKRAKRGADDEDGGGSGKDNDEDDRRRRKRDSKKSKKKHGHHSSGRSPRESGGGRDRSD